MKVINMATQESENSNEANKEQIRPKEKDIDRAIDIWKKAIDVQQHFNSIEMQIRNFAVTVLAGIIAAAGLALREPEDVVIFGYTISSASAILGAAVIVWLAFYFMDRWWYHRLLQGAVSHAQEIENQLKEVFPVISLSNAIRKTSPFYLFGVKRWRVGSDQKIDLFYFLIVIFLITAAYGVH